LLLKLNIKKKKIIIIFQLNKLFNMWNLKSSNELCSQRRTAEVKKKKREKKKENLLSSIKKFDFKINF
jgi:hypothetical protein